MWMDVWVVAALLAVGWIARVRSGRPGLPAWQHGDSIDWDRWLRALRHPFGVVALVWLALPSVGWVVTWQMAGPEPFARVSRAGAEEACHRAIDRLDAQMRGERSSILGRDEIADDIERKFPRKDGCVASSCPDTYGGTLRIDEEGFIDCSLHGRSPNVREPLAPRSAPDELGPEQTATLCHRRQEIITTKVCLAGTGERMRFYRELQDDYIENNFPQPDRYGGSLSIDGDGYVTCSVHGRAPDSHSVRCGPPYK